MMPIVDLAYFSDTLPEHLTNLILKHRLNGLVLRVRTMPDSEWFSKMEKMIEKTTADMIVVQQEDSYWPAAEPGVETDAEKELQRLKRLPQANVREIQRGSLLLHPVKDIWHLRVLSYPEWTDKIGKSAREGIDPFLVVLPRQYKELLGTDGEVKRAYVELTLPPAPETAKPDVSAAVKAADAEVARKDSPTAAAQAAGKKAAAATEKNGTQAAPPQVAAAAVTNAPAAGAESPQSLWQRLRSKIGPESAQTNGAPAGVTP